MILAWWRARRHASRTLIDSPRISPILRRAGMASAANAPWPSIALGPTATANFCGSAGGFRLGFVVAKLTTAVSPKSRVAGETAPRAGGGHDQCGHFAAGASVMADTSDLQAALVALNASAAFNRRAGFEVRCLGAGEIELS